MTAPEYATYEDEYQAELKAKMLKRVDDAMPVRYHGIEPPAETAEWREQMLAGKPSNLILVGPTGTGKTCAVWATLRDLVERDWHVGRRPGTWIYHRATDLAAALRPNADVETVIDKARKTPLLIIDDLGSAKLTDWQLEQLPRIVDSRWENARPTVITSNVPKLRDVLDDRLASRLQDGSTTAVLRGMDRRRTDSRPVQTAWVTAAEMPAPPALWSS
jgi:DNA replication protein DnaC